MERPLHLRRNVMAVVCATLILLSAGCLGLSSGESERVSPQTEKPTPAQMTGTPPNPTTSVTPEESQEWNATVAIHANKSSFASERYVFNGWNVSVQITSLDGAGEVIYVYESVNVVEGNSTRKGVVGTAVSDNSPERSMSLLQKGGTVTVYAVKGDERKQIGFLEITSSYVAPWDGERGWEDSWRGDPPEDMET